MKTPILTVEIRYEHDVVLCRQRARQIASRLGFDRQDQTRIATAVSEMARNVFQYAARGRVEFGVEEDSKPMFQIVISDRGPGIENLEAILDGRYQSKTGMGLGILGTRRLMDAFHIESHPGSGTTVMLGKLTPRNFKCSSQHLAAISDELLISLPQDPFEELQRQNQELMVMMGELEKRQAELAELNRELEATNRGVVALYAELDERADYLRRASEVKSRFLSNMTHEFRTPLNSILSLSRMLLERMDGELTEEQEKQVTFIKRAATDLSELVNDLLDLAKVEAGKIVIRPSEFKVADVFGALRGMLRPLLPPHSRVSLVFEEPEGIPTLNTDESRVSQILRNFISNAIKFTERGEILVSARRAGDEMVTISVSDTGVGIAMEDQSIIFEEFTQIENEHQRKAKGTGLGLPLARKLTGLLGGSVTVQSKPGEGSVFSVTLPLVYHGESEVGYEPAAILDLDPARLPVLVVDDNAETLFIYEKYLMGTGFQPVPARSLKEARLALARVRPLAIVLDILLGNESSWSWLIELKENAETRDIPVLVVSVVDNRRTALGLGAADFQLKPVERPWLLEKLRGLAQAQTGETILIIDDDEASRYLMQELLRDTGYEILEARGGLEGLQKAEARKPGIIFLDLNMRDLDGFAVLERLKGAKATSEIPVIINSARDLSRSEREALKGQAVAILPKNYSSREKSVVELRAALTSAERARQQEEPKHEH